MVVVAAAVVVAGTIHHSRPKQFSGATRASIAMTSSEIYSPPSLPLPTRHDTTPSTVMPAVQEWSKEETGLPQELFEEINKAPPSVFRQSFVRRSEQ